MNLFPTETANSKITFISSEFSTDRDPVTGNVLPTAPSVLFEADIYLKFAQNAQNESLPGIDSESIVVKGFLINPILFPDWVNVGTTFNCEFSFLGQTKRYGKLTLHALQNEMPTYLRPIQGDRFQGILMLGSVN